jgi:hypothetical protein
MMDLIVNAINSYAENARETTENYDHARRWEPVNSAEI